MRAIWHKHGVTLEGIAEDGLDEIVIQAIGSGFTKTWNEFKNRYIFGKEDIPIQRWLPNTITAKPKSHSKLEKIKLQLGMRYTEVNGWLKVTHVLDGGAAKLAGLAPGDLLASINGERITAARLDKVLSSISPDQVFTICFYRDDLEHECMTVLDLNQLPIQFDLIATA
ncbi:MAG: hypothetical protein B7Y05_25180 [Polynucleobacter sp. 24-46-87]|nr:MAG: hypothetical protein B7Y55_10580 [Polynucleobacter sp. 35-46-207]OZA00676.1 MAG: hypothetical protein B7Y05_25180 [Polynucleobacter sp. 24-46-87]OZB37099.1 MAG: hypothetical protein B7X60_13085 [Polynucleobacter sp. 39-45-136]